MAQFRTMIRTDLDRPLQRYTINGKMFTQDNKANRIDVAVYHGNEPVTLGGTITGIVKRNDGRAVAFAGGIEEGVAYIELPESAYAVEGPISILLRNTDGELKTVIGICDAYVTKTADADYVTAGENVIGIQDLMDNLDQIDTLVSRMAAVNVVNLANLTTQIETLNQKLDDVDTALGAMSDAMDEVDSWSTSKVSTPVSSPNGTQGQLLSTNGDGTTTWVDIGTPTDEQANTAISAWLELNPDATTTVTDGSISYAKLNTSLKQTVNDVNSLILNTDYILDTAVSITEIDDGTGLSINIL